MKNLSVSIIFFFLCIPVAGQHQMFGIDKDSFLMIDTVNAISQGDFYVGDITAEEPNHIEIVRKLSEKHAIIRSRNSRSILQKKYFKLDNTWKVSSNISNDERSSHDQRIFSVKYVELNGSQFLKRYPDVELIRTIDNAKIALIRTTYDFLTQVLIHDPNVVYVDLVDRRATEESPIRQYNIYLNRINYARHNYPLLKGQNMNISIKEHSIFEGDIDLIGRVILDDNSSNQFTQHAKEMGTLIAGNGNSFMTGQGVVSQANLVCTNFDLLFAEPVSYYDNYLITLQNHSYGTNIENFYGNESISFDQLVGDRPELVHVFSAGNMGDLAPQQGIYKGIEGYANLTGTFKQAKNVLVVGALDSAGNYVERSSSGPTYDGRIKPELCAFGGEGSSESAALVSGSVAMLQEHYMNLQKRYPSSSMIKSLLIAGADDVHTTGIDYKTGYGSLDLNSSLQILDSGWFEGDVIDANGKNVLELTVPQNVEEIKVVLAWIDPPANPEDATALVNDLDMSILSPLDQVYLPWTLNADPNAALLAELPVRGEDHLNNVEMISLENPSSGVYTIEISSSELVGDNQKYSVAYNIKYKDNFTWTFPTSSDQLQGGSQPYFRWENSYSGQEAIVMIRYGEGTWESVGKVDIEAGLFKHSLMDTSIHAQLKMVFSGQEFLSDTFTITKLPGIRVENDCEDEFILSWSNIENTEVYSLFELQDGQMVPILSLKDTIVTLNKTIYQGSHYAVQPAYPQGRTGLRSYAINYEDNNKGCYLNNFLAFLAEDGLVKVQLSVNLPQDIGEITIRKEQYGSGQMFVEFQPGSTSYFEFEDEDIRPGQLAYSTQLILKKGTVIHSDTLSLFFTDENTVIVFPNPTYEDFVSVLNDFPGGSLQLLDSKGTFVRTYELVNMVDHIDLTGLRSGTYLFRIFYKGETVYSGKMIRM